jgi:DNA-binding transcriptional LysR family regulator
MLSAPVVLTDDRGALADALIAGAGVGLLPDFLGEPACATGALLRLESTPVAHMPVHALFLPA